MALHYVAAADGTAIAYRVQGEGQNIVVTNGLAASDFFWQGLLPRLSQNARVIIWDLKGHGASAPAQDPKAATIDGAVDDLRRVLEAAEVDQAVFVGFSMGCQIILEAYRQMPERVRALLPILGTYERPFDQLLHPRVGPYLGRLLDHLPVAGMAPLFATTARTAPYVPGLMWLNKQLGVVGQKLERRDMRGFYAHLGQMHAATWLALAQSAAKHSASDVLATIAVPTLVIVGGRDGFTLAQQGREMAQRIAGAELFAIPEAAHTGLLEYPELIVDRMLGFCTQHKLIA